MGKGLYMCTSIILENYMCTSIILEFSPLVAAGKGMGKAALV